MPAVVWMLCALTLGCAVFVPGFADAGNLGNVARQTAVLGLLAAGQTFVIAAGMIDLTVGALATLVVVLAAQIMDAQTNMLWPGIGLALLLGTGIGLATGLLNEALRIHSLILTIGLMTVLMGVVFIYTDQSTGAPAPQLAALANDNWGGVPASLLLLLLLLALLHLVLRHTRFGLHVQAIGSSQEGASHAGVPVARVRVGAFALSGLLTAVAGLILLGRLGTGYPNAGSGMELDAVVAVVLGGTLLSGGRASVVGSVAAAGVLGVLSNALNLLEVSSFVQMTIKGVIVVAVVVLNRPRSGANP